MKSLACLLLLLVCCVLPSCSSTQVTVTVTRDHRLPAKGAGQTFAMVDLSKSSSSGLQKAAILGRISAHLVRYGWKPAPPGTQPDFGVGVDYWMGASHRELFSAPIYESVGGGTVYHSGTVSSVYGGSASSSGTSYQAPSLEMVGVEHYTKVLHDRYLMLGIYDNKK